MHANSFDTLLNSDLPTSMRSPEERTAQFMDINRCVDDDGRSIVTNHWHTQVYDEWNAHTWHHTIPRSHIEE